MGRLRDVAVDIAPLRRSRQFRLLFTGLATSALGSRITDVAVPVQIYALTHSTLAVGLLGLVALVPRLTLSIIGGALADRLDRRRLLLLTEVGGLGCSLVLAVNAFAPNPQLWLIYVVVFVASACAAVNSPAQRSAVPLIVDRELVVPAMALKAMVYSSAWLLGPLLAGVLVFLGGVQLTYLADAATFLGGLIALAAMKPIPPVAAVAQSTLGSVVEGLKELRGRGALIGSFVMDLNAMVFGLPVALFPAVVDERFGGNSLALGALYAAPFAGSLVASGTSGWARHVHRQGIAVTIFVVLWGLAIVGFGLVDGAVASVVFLALAGGFDMASGVFRQAILALATPPEMLGRMEGVGMAVWTTGPALGDLEAGTVAAFTSVNTSIVSGGVLCAVFAVVLYAVLPAFAHYDDREMPVPMADQPAA